MKILEVKLTNKQARDVLSAHKRYLIDEGGNENEDIQDITLENVFEFAVYSHLEYIGARSTNFEFSSKSDKGGMR